MKKYLPVVLALLIAACALLLYWNTLAYDFVNFDDPALVERNTYIKSLSFENIKAIFTPGVVGSYQPMRTLSYALDYHFWRLDPRGYHLTNILCHAGSALLVFALARLLGQHLLVAALAALLFAAHPVQVEAVAWVSGRRDVLATLFALLAVIAFVRFLPPRRNVGRDHVEATSTLRWLWYALSLFFFAAGLQSKPSVVILPLLLVLYDLCFAHPPLQRRWRRMGIYAPYFLFSLIFTQTFLSLARSSGVVESNLHGADAFERALIMLRVFGEYIVMLLVPQNFSVTYGVPVVSSAFQFSVLFGLFLLTSLTLLLFPSWKRSKLVVFGILWFPIGLLPVANIIPIAIVKADRYLYLPAIGLFLTLAWLIAHGNDALGRLKDSAGRIMFVRAAYWTVIGVILLSFALLTMQRVRDWKDSHTLWSATLETNPDSPIALNNLGLLYAEEGMYEKAIALYEQLLVWHPDQEHVERVHVNMAAAYFGLGMHDEALDAYQKALERNPQYIDAYLGLAQVSIELRQYAHAEKIYRNALDLEIQRERVFTRLGNLYVIQGKYEDADRAFQHALERNPRLINAYHGLGMSAARQGRTQQALTYYEQALGYEPESTMIHNSLGSLYMQLGENDKAIEAFTTTLTLDPDLVDVQNNLGVLFLHGQRYEEAARQFMGALKQQPDQPKVLTNLGTAYTHLGLYEQAAQMYQWALEIDPTLYRTQLLLGDVCFRMANPACARQAYEAALALKPESREVLQRLDALAEREAAP